MRIRKKKWMAHSREPAAQKSGKDSVVCLKIALILMTLS